MESIGEKLRKARLSLGLTLDAVSSSTRINLRTLTAIEADQLDQISSPFLYKSFVRQIGQAVGLDSQALEQDLLSAAESMPKPLVPGQDGAPLPPATASRHRRNPLARWVYSIASFCLMLMACSGLYAFWQSAKTESPSQFVASFASFLHINSPAAAVKPRSSAQIIRPEQKTHAALPSSANLATQANPAGQTNDDGLFHIQLSAIEQSWLSIATDGKEVYSGILHAAETKTLEGHEVARIRTGNAGGVEVVFNGHNLGPLGSRGQVRTVLFNRNGYEVLDSEAAALIPAHLLLAAYHPAD
jgi:cytoskeletal protein RodZ